jgi:hypothetical protein
VGEESITQFNAAIADTGRNPTGIAPLVMTLSDQVTAAEGQVIIDVFNALVVALQLREVRAGPVFHGGFRGAHASRVLAKASRVRGLWEGFGISAVVCGAALGEVRFGGTPKPTRGTRVLPGLVERGLAKSCVSRARTFIPISSSQTAQ